MLLGPFGEIWTAHYFLAYALVVVHSEQKGTRVTTSLAETRVADAIRSRLTYVPFEDPRSSELHPIIVPFVIKENQDVEPAREPRALPGTWGWVIMIC
jgi:hypothetical protein